MSKISCPYCNKEYTNKTVLLKHQTTTKKCLEIQKSLNIKSNIQIFSCQFCDKILTTKQRKNDHENICKVKKEKIIEDNLSELEFLKNEIESLNKILKIHEANTKKYKKELEINKKELVINKKELEQFKIENQKLREEVACLKATNQVYSEIAKNNYPITINNNNTKTNNNYSKNITFNSSLNLNDIDTISNIINNKYNINHILQGQKGIAHFVLENFLKDDDGNLKYICSDPSRKVFNYQNEEGVVEKDLSANKLTNGIVAGGIKEKTINLASDWYKKQDESIDHDKFNIVMKKQESILEIDQDNNTFKNELAVMTSR